MLHWLFFFFKSHVPRIDLSDFAKKYFPTCCHHQQIFYQMACTCFIHICCKSETHFLFSCLAIIHIIWQVGKLQERYIVVLTAQPRFHFFHWRVVYHFLLQVTSRVELWWQVCNCLYIIWGLFYII